MNARARVSDAFMKLILAAPDDALNRLVDALDGLKDEEPRIFNALFGQTLLNDILSTVEAEWGSRAKPTGGNQNG